jgi:hypothetical protein
VGVVGGGTRVSGGCLRVLHYIEGVSPTTT